MKIGSKVNGLRQFSNRDVNITLPGASLLNCLYFTRYSPGGRKPEATETGHPDREAHNFNRNLRAISEDFAPFSFMQV